MKKGVDTGKYTLPGVFLSWEKKTWEYLFASKEVLGSSFSGEWIFTVTLVPLSLCILYFLFHKVKDTSGILQPSIRHLVYVFPIFFRFHKCFNNFHLSKNIFINKFFHWNVFLDSFTFMTQGRCQFLFEAK